MRIPSPSFWFSILASAGSLAVPASAQTVKIDTYWLRESGAKKFDDMAPFRTPKGVGHIPGPLRDTLTDLQEMRRLAADANKLQLKIDVDGREICSVSSWTTAYENVKANSLKMSGWLGIVMRDDTSVLKRRTAIYGMVYFNNPQEVIELISMLPGEPMRDLREDGFQRALRFLKAHYHKSKPQNSRFPDNGIVVPRYDFNPRPFFLLLDQEDDLDKAQGLWFLAEVLRIRPDLGRIYLQELRERMPGLLLAKNPKVRLRAIEFLATIERQRDRVPDPTAFSDELEKWLKDLEYDLFPPIRHRSLGLVELYPSDDLDAVIKIGRGLLTDSMLPRASARTKSGTVRYGVRLARLPPPLDKLGLPQNALIVAINAEPIQNAKDLGRILESYFAQFAAKKKGAAPATKQPPRTPSIQVEYIYKKKALLKEFRIIQ